MQKAFESIKLGQNAKDDLETTESLQVAQNNLSVGEQPDLTSGHSVEMEKSPPQTNGNLAHTSVKQSIDRDEVRVMQKVLGNEVYKHTVLFMLKHFKHCISLGQPRRPRVCSDS